MAREQDPEIDQRILAVATDLLNESGYEALTVAAVADRADVGRPTVYRRWQNRAALVFDVLLRDAVPPELPDLGSFRAELIAATSHLVESMAGSDRLVMGEMLGLMVSDERFARRVHERNWLPNREAVLVMWERAVVRGEVNPSLDGRQIIDEVAAATMLQVLFWHRTDSDWVESFVDRVLAGVRP